MQADIKIGDVLSVLSDGKLKNELESYIDAIRLARFNPRPRTICAITRISYQKAKEIIISAHGHVPLKGRGIENLQNYIKNKDHRRNISYIILAYREAMQLGLEHTEAIIQAYGQYFDTALKDVDSRAFVDIDYAYFLIVATNNKIDFDMRQCHLCKTDYFYSKYELPLICPFCSNGQQLATVAA